MPTLSLCMIVYNEEKNIRRCLESAAALSDEIIIIDTGSTDNTLSICKEYDARIIPFTWTGNFSEARNFGLSKATGDWILVLDADEELKIRNLAGFLKYLSETPCDACQVRMLHFYGQQPVDESRAHIAAGLRLFRNCEGMRFTGKVYEKLDIRQKSVGDAADTRCLLQILHYGYLESARKEKNSSYIPLLIKEKEVSQNNPWLNTYLAAEYYKSGNISDAYMEINNAIALFLKNGIKPPALTYKLKYDLLITSRQFSLAYNGIEKASVLYPDYVDLCFYKGILQYNLQEYDNAKQTFHFCLILGEDNPEYLTLAGSGSFLALYYLGLCHAKKEQYKQAAEAFRQAEALCPELGSAKQLFKYI